MNGGARVGRFAVRHGAVIAFGTMALGLGGILAAGSIPSSVFPQTDFPRVVILVDAGVMPADQMMAAVTRPIEESMKDIPGSVSVRSATGRGSAEINVFFTWAADMVQSELFVIGRLSQIRASLPAGISTSVFRLTFSAFPILGVSLTSPDRSITELWEMARYDLKPRFLRIRGVARVDLVGGRSPEFQVVVDPTRLLAVELGLPEVAEALDRNGIVAPTGMHEENHTLYLTVVDGRLRNAEEIGNLVVKVVRGHPVRIRDFARVEQGAEPAFHVVTAEGVNAVLLNVRSQPDGSTLQIARDLRDELARLRPAMPADLKLAFFYDQSEIVRDSVRGVWEAIVFGLVLSVGIIYLFLRRWGVTLVATLVIPFTVLITLVAIRALGLGFNLMTLGGIAAAIGLVIDDAIVAVEAIHVKVASAPSRAEGIEGGIAEILRPLIASTLTPVVVFIPLAYLSGITGVFFRALALTMVVALLTSLVLAVTLTPSLAAWLLPASSNGALHSEEGGALLQRLVTGYEIALRRALRYRWLTLGICGLVLVTGFGLYRRLRSEFLPPMDEGAFVIDYFTPPGTSLAETNRELLQVERILRDVPEVESYSRRTGARLALAIAEPHTGDFLVKLKRQRQRRTEDVISELRRRFHEAAPTVNWEFPGILSDLIGDLMWAPKPIEIKLYSNDVGLLKQEAPKIAEQLRRIPGVVDIFDGLVYTGTTLSLRLRPEEARRFGLSTSDVARTVNAAMLGERASTVLQGDRLIGIRVRVDSSRLERMAMLKDLPIRGADGALVQLRQVADFAEVPGELELRREDMRQDVAVTARLEGRDLGGAMAEIQRTLRLEGLAPAGSVEYGGLYQQQQESFRNLLRVLGMAIALVFTVLVVEFRSFREPVAIVFGAVLAMFGTVLGLWLTGTSLNVVSFLGVIIGVGIVAKNGILMLDRVETLRSQGLSLEEALVDSGRRRLRPVLMTSLAAALGMLPLAYGVGSGADMLKPLAVAVIGALGISVALSLVATPVALAVLRGASPDTPVLHLPPHHASPGRRGRG